MRHDNDVKTVTTVRAKTAHLVRAHLTPPRRAAIAGLTAAIIGTGALALSAAPAAGTPPTSATAATPTAGHRAATVTRSLDRAGKPTTTTKTTTTAKTATATKAAAAPRTIATAK